VYVRREGGGDVVVIGGGVLLFLPSVGGVCGRELLDRLLLSLAIVHGQKMSRRTDC
jgi:hypothetical protein